MRGPAALRVTAAALAAAVAVATSGCGGDDGDRPAAEAGPVISDPGVSHIHGLGVDPADRSLIIATHTGLFRAAAGQVRAKRIGDRRQDTMGFTVVGPNRFLGSGHPDLRDDLPPLLGLIRSSDAGRSWRPVSLLGKADFHVLRAEGDHVYGVNSADGQLLVSGDEGLRWARRTPPAVPFDLAPRPGRAAEVVAATEKGLFVSRDEGRRWRPLSEDKAGLLAWPAPDRLYLVDGEGAVHVSADGGSSWRRVGEAGGQPAAFATHDGDLYVALHTDEVKVSDDGGRTWRLRVSA